MDYTNNPESNQHPNQHDYDELVTITAKWTAAPRCRQRRGVGNVAVTFVINA